jgi:pimeloyl-ACP methyl ester carboxylesterase
MSHPFWSSGHPGPTIVLVHGAFADASSWNVVVDCLHGEGLPVVSVANPLRGLAADTAYLRSVIDAIPGPVVVVGHSYGAAVVGEATEGATNVRALVFVAGFALEPGESMAELSARFAGGELLDALVSVPFTAIPVSTYTGYAGRDLYIDRDRFHRVFGADLHEAEAGLLAVAQRPITAAALQDKATKAGWRAIPSWFLVTTADRALSPESMRFMASRAAARTVEVDASHAVVISEPDAVIDMILDAVHETAS